MVNQNQSPRLVKHIIRSYARLSENTRVRSILKENLPLIFKDKTFQSNLDETSKKWINSIFKHLGVNGNSKHYQEIEINISKEQNATNQQSTPISSTSNNLK